MFDIAIKHCRQQLKLQNLFILLSSYLFYGWWDWRFLILIAFTSFCSWWSGIWMQQVAEKSLLKEDNDNNIPKATVATRTRRWIAASNIVINLLILAIFKYYNFFISEFAQLFSIPKDDLLLKIILPVGISFYTFQALSYSIDVYKGKIKPTKDIIAFFAYIAFFPQLVAGPIERATNLLPQFLEKKKFSYAMAADGMRQILWGLFKKIAVADNCAVFVNHVFSSPSEQNGCNLLLAAVLFTFQIYGDFSGYSDIAIGTAKLFGIRLMQNFKTPYFSRDIAEFWRRWHISLTTWFRDYVYIPLGGSRVSKAKIVRNTFVIFLLSGLWHGSGWTFIAWGAYHATLFLPLILTNRNRKNINQVAAGKLLPSLKETGQIGVTFLLVLVGWILFRSESISQFWDYLCGMWQWGTFRACYRAFSMWQVRAPILLALLMLIIEWIQRNKEHGLQLGNLSWPIRYSVYLMVCIAIICFYSQPVTFTYILSILMKRFLLKFIILFVLLDGYIVWYAIRVYPNLCGEMDNIGQIPFGSEYSSRMDSVFPINDIYVRNIYADQTNTTQLKQSTPLETHSLHRTNLDISSSLENLSATPYTTSFITLKYLQRTSSASWSTLDASAKEAP